MSEPQYPLFKHAEGVAHDQNSIEVAKERMLSITEATLGILGLDVEHAAGKLLHTVVKLCGLQTYTRNREQILALLGCTPRTLQRILKLLQDEGLIRVGHGPGRRKTIVIQAVWSNIVAVSESSPEVVWVSSKDATLTRHESDTKCDIKSDIDTTSERHPRATAATSERHLSDIHATFENPSLYNTNASHFRCRSRSESTAAAAEEISIDEVQSASDSIVSAFPKHMRPSVARVAWELAFVCLSAKPLSGGDHLAEQRAAIRCKQSFSSPENYLRGCARGICEDVGLDYRVLLRSCPSRPAAPPPAKQSTTQPVSAPRPNVDPDIEQTDLEKQWIQKNVPAGLRQTLFSDNA